MPVQGLEPSCAATSCAQDLQTTLLDPCFDLPTLPCPGRSPLSEHPPTSSPWKLHVVLHQSCQSPLLPLRSVKTATDADLNPPVDMSVKAGSSLEDSLRAIKEVRENPEDHKFVPLLRDGGDQTPRTLPSAATGVGAGPSTGQSSSLPSFELSNSSHSSGTKDSPPPAYDAGPSSPSYSEPAQSVKGPPSPLTDDEQESRSSVTLMSAPGTLANETERKYKLGSENPSLYDQASGPMTPASSEENLGMEHRSPTYGSVDSLLTALPPMSMAPDSLQAHARRATGKGPRRNTLRRAFDAIRHPSRFSHANFSDSTQDQSDTEMSTSPAFKSTNLPNDMAEQIPLSVAEPSNSNTANNGKSRGGQSGTTVHVHEPTGYTWTREEDAPGFSWKKRSAAKERAQAMEALVGAESAIGRTQIRRHWVGSGQGQGVLTGLSAALTKQIECPLSRNRTISRPIAATTLSATSAASRSPPPLPPATLTANTPGRPSANSSSTQRSRRAPSSRRSPSSTAAYSRCTARSSGSSGKRASCGGSAGDQASGASAKGTRTCVEARSRARGRGSRTLSQCERETEGKMHTGSWKGAYVDAHAAAGPDGAAVCVEEGAGAGEAEGERGPEGGGRCVAGDGVVEGLQRGRGEGESQGCIWRVCLGVGVAQGSEGCVGQFRAWGSRMRVMQHVRYYLKSQLGGQPEQRVGRRRRHPFAEVPTLTMQVALQSQISKSRCSKFKSKEMKYKGTPETSQRRRQASMTGAKHKPSKGDMASSRLMRYPQHIETPDAIPCPPPQNAMATS
ncbi:hypothetical protein FH972_022083 [Carpinus fangiana]|uniref:Uncharacterized protein n=1 Tax=Carpinus fangiana TaxID=176857 RepID=A0A5N6KRK1_9ROSI|nr:hypothetical protein FH972_022083 [Carpinus fangiana]